MKTCGNCKYFTPERNPETGRVLPSKPGTCGWKLPLPEGLKIPMCYEQRVRVYAIKSVWRDSCADRCLAHEPVKSVKPDKINNQQELEWHGPEGKGSEWSAF